MPGRSVEAGSHQRQRHPHGKGGCTPCNAGQGINNYSQTIDLAGTILGKSARTAIHAKPTQSRQISSCDHSPALRNIRKINPASSECSLWAIVNHAAVDVCGVLWVVRFSSGTAGSHSHALLNFVGSLPLDVRSQSARHTYEGFFSVETRRR